MTPFLSSNIKYIRKSVGYSQTKFAKVLEKATTSISEYENGNTEPNLSVIIKIKEHFGFTPDEILTVNLIEKFTKNDILKRYQSVKKEKSPDFADLDVSLNVSPSVSLNQKSKGNTGTSTQLQIGQLKGNLNAENPKKPATNQETIHRLQAENKILQDLIQSQQSTINNLNLLIQKISTT